MAIYNARYKETTTLTTWGGSLFYKEIFDGNLSLAGGVETSVIGFNAKLSGDMYIKCTIETPSGASTGITVKVYKGETLQNTYNMNAPRGVNTIDVPVTTTAFNNYLVTITAGTTGTTKTLRKVAYRGYIIDNANNVI